MRYQGKRHRHYKREVVSFARRLGTDTKATWSNAEIVSTVKALTASYGIADERLVVADVQDAMNEIVQVMWPGAPYMKTRDELLAEGRHDLVEILYPKGGTIEEVLLAEEGPSGPT
jgi:hypothetical protein